MFLKIISIFFSIMGLEDVHHLVWTITVDTVQDSLYGRIC